MAIFRMGFHAGLVLIGAIAVFVGLAVAGIALKDGSLTYSYLVDGQRVAQTIARAANADRYWQMLMLWGGIPILLGALAAWHGWRQLTRP